MLKWLNKVNDMPIYGLDSMMFQTYGREITGYDFRELTRYIEEKGEMPREGNVYYASVEEMEAMEVCEEIKNNFYGEMPIEVGYCNGKNSTLNGFEYHKGSEINVAATDFMLFLGHTWDVQENTYEGKNAQVFYVQKGQAFELYGTTLHLSPCKTSAEGFRAVVILPKDTNMPLTQEKTTVEPTDTLLLMKNKWVIAHPQRKQLIDKGAFAGVIGENQELFY